MTKVIVIVGPTATGKSAAGIELAAVHNGQIISADSIQVYRHLDIGSGKVTDQETRGIPHHLIDIADPQDRFTVEDYRQLGNHALEKILNDNSLPIIVGGTGYYIDALVKNTRYPQISSDIKHELDQLDLVGLQNLADNKIGRDKFNNSDYNNPLRLRSRIGLYLTHDHLPRPEIIARREEIEFCWLGINPGLETIKSNVTRRTSKRIESGLVEEVKRLLEGGVSTDWLLNIGLTYRAVINHLTNNTTIADLENEIIYNELSYAKRQLTWFKRNKDINWLVSRNEINYCIKNNFKL